MKTLLINTCLRPGHDKIIFPIGIGYIATAMDKKVNVPTFMEQTRVLRKGGVMPTTSVIVGYPGETPETLKATFDVCKEVGINPSVGYLLPQPGTPVYLEAIERGVIGPGIDGEEAYLFEMGDRQDFRVNLTDMPRKDMEDLVEEHLLDLRKSLGVDLDGGSTKTGHYKQPDRQKELRDEGLAPRLGAM